MAKTTLVATGRRWFNGAFGNLSVSPTFVAKLNATASGDEIVFGDKVEPNIKIIGVTLISTALGSSTTVTVKIGKTAITDAEATDAAVKKYIPVDELLTQEGQEIAIAVGGGAATGTVKVKLHYEVVGNI
ncbi:hypothetical protein IHE26_08245 [Plesiomonas shigelloides]|uniref:hypothetical protein n=1 Tax=Plesiomonas shigelloides TaxID=703 RepID=UPI000A107781|nr:hypothetical protein [Plesiomonas shigelloides]QOH78458.1 hypothetical protein IHE26_08245 [Plesiomonas shigelloides]